MPNEFTLLEVIDRFASASRETRVLANAGRSETAMVYARLADAHARIIAAFINTQTTVVRFPDE